jgi:hypothetical protein
MHSEKVDYWREMITMSDQLLQNPAVRDVHDYLASAYDANTAARYLKVMASPQSPRANTANQGARVADYWYGRICPLLLSKGGLSCSQIRLLLGVPETERRQLSSAIQYLVRQGAIFTKPLPSDSRLNLYYLGEED